MPWRARATSEGKMEIFIFFKAEEACLVKLTEGIEASVAGVLTMGTGRMP